MSFHASVFRTQKCARQTPPLTQEFDPSPQYEYRVGSFEVVSRRVGINTFLHTIYFVYMVGWVDNESHPNPPKCGAVQCWPASWVIFSPTVLNVIRYVVRNLCPFCCCCCCCFPAVIIVVVRIDAMSPCSHGVNVLGIDFLVTN